jgi:hypothetical protein
LGLQIANKKIAKNIGPANCKSANCHSSRRSTNVTNIANPQICGFSEAWGKMIPEKALRRKSCDTVPLKQNIRAHKNALMSLHKFYKNIIS